MSTPVTDQANLCGTSAATAYLTLNKTPRPSQQSQTVRHQITDNAGCKIRTQMNRTILKLKMLQTHHAPKHNKTFVNYRG